MVRYVRWLLLCGVAVVLVQVMTAAPAQEGAEPPARLEVENAALTYWQAYAALDFPDMSEDVDLGLLIMDVTAGEVPYDPDRLEPIVARNDRALRLLRLATRRPWCSFGVDPTAGREVFTEHYSVMRGFIDPLTLLIRREQALGRTDLLPDLYHDMLAMGGHLDGDGVVMSWLVGAAIVQRGLMELIRGVGTGQPDMAWLQQVLRVLDAVESRPLDLGKAIEGERIVLLHTYDKLDAEGWLEGFALVERMEAVMGFVDELLGALLEEIGAPRSKGGAGGAGEAQVLLSRKLRATIGGSDRVEGERLEKLLGMRPGSLANEEAFVAEMRRHLIDVAREHAELRTLAAQPYPAVSTELAKTAARWQSPPIRVVMDRLIGPTQLVSCFEKSARTRAHLAAARIFCLARMAELRTSALPTTLVGIAQNAAAGSKVTLPSDPFTGRPFSLSVTAGEMTLTCGASQRDGSPMQFTMTRK
ncbi:hypothetical protein ACFL59_16645 [Planctomycetota bacterium]